ncbi:hypothetical protein [Pseudoalteromonas luteoviolacea]|uniref:hypothetical protein n=1 Tax=Pseudoalteromonas luteoviolacea TaxID=43657 RepID=UPI001B387AFC|nr:hypothetical protein [Pseudoalteromonas luteoviolacea]MBQ4835681.1 hypothetical protein [Pseudoalteromonas luteoviolacea]
MTKEPWVNSEILAGEPLVGNKEGLEQLKIAIEQVLDGSSTSQCQLSLCDNISVHIQETQQYYTAQQEDNRTWLQKLRDNLIASLLFSWLFLLPLAALAHFANDIYAQPKPEPRCLIPNPPLNNHDKLVR